jgi:hypothetical protein
MRKAPMLVASAMNLGIDNRSGSGETPGEIGDGDDRVMDERARRCNANGAASPTLSCLFHRPHSDGGDTARTSDAEFGPVPPAAGALPARAGLGLSHLPPMRWRRGIITSPTDRRRPCSRITRPTARLDPPSAAALDLARTAPAAPPAAVARDLRDGTPPTAALGNHPVCKPASTVKTG